MTTSSDALEEILSLDISKLRASRQAHWHRLLDGCKGQVFVFGAGELGLKTLDGLLAEGIRPLALLDNRVVSASQTIMGIPVITPAQAADSIGTQALCLIAVFNTSAPRAQLASMGFRNVAHCIDAFAGLPSRFLPFVCLDDTDIVSKSADRLRLAYSLMSDEPSKHTFIAQLRHRLFLDFDTVLAPQTAKMKASEYFPQDIYRPLDDEIMVDCGAFHGDTIDRFIALRKGIFSLIYALEPDLNNFAVLQDYISGLGPTLSSRIKALANGVGERSEVISFYGDGSVRSGASENGNGSVQIEKLDDICASISPTLIKMDIEGAETNAIRGAAQLIATHSPVLAICVYHASAHLWEVPLLAAELNPKYRIYLRAHAEDCWDVTCYAVPQYRCIT
jgi:FkbM family methyltransferase